MNRRTFLAASAATLSAAPAVLAADKPAKLVMLAGSPSHGPGDHEFHAGVRLLEKCLKQAVPTLETVVVTNGYPKDEAVFDGAAGILSYADGGGGHPLLRGDRLKRIDALMQRGVGLMCAHYAVEVPKDLGAAEFRRWIGGCYEHAYSCNPMWAPEYKAFPDHPVTRGVKPFSVRDEWYMTMRFRDGMQGVTPLLTATPSDAVRDGPYVYPKGPYKHIQDAKGRPEHMMWAADRPDGGRGVGFTGGHTHANWGNASFRKVVLNALLWICKLDVPAGGVESAVTAEDLRANLDPKPRRK